MKNRILITGDSGHIGGELAKSLASKYDIVGISRNSGFDITLVDSIATLKGSLNIIIHCAASFLDDTIDSMLQNEMVNSIGTLNICKLAAEKHCKPHYAGYRARWLYNEPYHCRFAISPQG